jgi:two-component system NarL family sensor kinase
MQAILAITISTIIISTLFILLITFFLVRFVLLYQKRHQSFIKEKADLQSNFKQTLLQAQLEIQEQTMQNISQEIHDNIGQVLSLAKLNLGTMDIAQPAILQQKIDDSKNLIGKAIQDLRDLSKSLNTDYVSNMGLLQAIEYELEMIRKSGEYETTLQVNGLPFKVEPQKELITFRIVQEMINNILKHARANKILVQALYSPTAIAITITDNGAGFDLNPLNTTENGQFGLGLRNMHTRAQLIGAGFTITSTIGSGTSVSIILPVQPEAFATSGLVQP